MTYYLRCSVTLGSVTYYSITLGSVTYYSITLGSVTYYIEAYPHEAWSNLYISNARLW